MTEACVTCGEPVEDKDQFDCRECDADPLCGDCFDAHDCDDEEDDGDPD